MSSSLILLSLAFVICITNLFSEAKNLPAIIVGTVYCNSTYLVSGASVELECGDRRSRLTFRRETVTDGRGEFRVQCPFPAAKCVKRIKKCSVKLLGRVDQCCASASTASSSSPVRLKPRNEGDQILFAGIFSVPQKQPDRYRQRSPSSPILKQTEKANEIRFQDKRRSRYPKKTATSPKLQDQKFFFFPPPWFLPQNPFAPPPSIFPPNPFQPPPPSIFPPNPFQPPPPSIFPPLPFQPPPAPPPSILPPIFPQPPPAPPPSLFPPIFPQPPPAPPPSIIPPIFPPNPFQPRPSPPPPPPPFFPPLPPLFPPFPGLFPSPPPPPPPPPPRPFIPFPPFPFLPPPRNPGPPPASSSSTKEPSP